ncbi:MULTISPECIES: HAD-IIA family hydrolase [Gordonia]|uniref:HAD-IIA family hydrolase n=1 Tax=Gordonia TaxID=2053 RepID=UPI0016516113|nr:MULTISPECIES: HAD-IIA family hydrolase [Gordonia]MDH3007009.1 HAD-IIA family hydrolase [Gordonia alkanivorans]MDH3018048.1 HAD-IIA family hydrolase [Gordonia alkanivorans]MDH3020399.1 HAD-IIA family hydrolase [Gordonia alkanivorans]MDH3024687.1 HAD-IIA family hydrolase [Gordonia alkanivorans]MDH3043461.1 HAD-IIA family hydrolase [Gordonia alkanivorans]
MSDRDRPRRDGRGERDTRDQRESRGQGGPRGQRGSRGQGDSSRGDSGRGRRPDRPGRERGDGGRRQQGPPLPDDLNASDLDPEVRRDLLTLDKANAEIVAKHLVMVSRLLLEEPALALEHARAARGRASRVGVVRETTGIAAYNAGEWQESATELRAARRITGNNALLPLIADCERGLGRPERAVEIARGDEGRALTGEEATEMRIVEAGARIDLGEPEKAVVTLQAENLKPGQVGTGPARLFYAYASALYASGRRDEAITWFMNAAAADIDDVTDAEFRLTELANDDTPVGNGEPDVDGVDVLADSAVSEVPAASEQAKPEAVTGEPVTAEPAPAETSPAPEPVADPEPVAAPEPVSVPEPIAAPEPVTAPERVASSEPADTDTIDSLEGTADLSATSSYIEEGSTGSQALVDRYDALLLDLDGTVFAGHQALPNAVDTLDRLDIPRFFVTNNASRRPAEVAAHLRELGFDATDDLVVTSAQSGARLLSEHLPPGSRALVIGTDGLAQEVREVGIGVTRSADDRPAAVIQGHSTDTGWAQLSEAALAIRAGALWVATNVDATLPSERGLLVGNGSMVAALRNATGKEPLVAGKPAAPLMADAIARAAANSPLVVGDRLDTDIEGAHAVGIESALVLTGVSTVTDLLAAPPEQRPTYVIDDLAGVFDEIDAVRVADQPGWTVSVEASTVTVSGSGDVIGLVPALAAATWAAVDAGTADPEELRIRAEGPARDKLASLGVTLVG